MILIFRIIIYPMLLTSMVMAYNTLGIGVNVSNPLQSATFYHNNIYYGVDFLHISISPTSITETDYADSWQSDVTDTYDGQVSVNLLMPRLGFRSHGKTWKIKPLGNEEDGNYPINMGRVHTYNQIEGYLMIPMIKTSGDLKLSSDAEDEIKDALDLMGFKVSHCVQYNFTSQLSLVAEVGLNWIFWDKSTEYENQYSSYTKKYEDTLNANLSMTYTKMSLHFKLK